MTDRNFKVIAQVREDLDDDQKFYIKEEMKNLQQKFNIENDGKEYYKAGEIKGYEDFGAVAVFYCLLEPYKEYFARLEYYDVEEGEKKIAI
ncbi:MAG: hypothetical protein Q4A29_07815 [Eubacteriales bacterium]|nr:hypothetical protein [Eubacteriales bacterium]